MLFSMVPQLRGHVYYHAIRSWIAIALMCGIFWYVPAVLSLIAEYTHEGSTEEMGLAARYILEWWAPFFYAMFVLTVVVQETSGYQMLKRAVTEETHPRVFEILREVCAKAKVSPLPAVIILPNDKGIFSANAAAMRSIFGGRKVLLSGGMHELPTPALRAIIAHEVVHSKHLDGIALVPLIAMKRNFDVYRRLIPILVAAIFFAGVIGFVLGFIGESDINALTPRDGDMTFILYAWGALIVVDLIFDLIFFAYSRSREYLADAGAIKILGWEDRRHMGIALTLTTALHSMDAGLKARVARKMPTILRSHPPLRSRVQAMQVKYMDPDRVATGTLASAFGR